MLNVKDHYYSSLIQANHANDCCGTQHHTKKEVPKNIRKSLMLLKSANLAPLMGSLIVVIFKDAIFV